MRKVEKSERERLVETIKNLFNCHSVLIWLWEKNMLSQSSGTVSVCELLTAWSTGSIFRFPGSLCTTAQHKVLNFDDYVLTTEAHPLLRTKKTEQSNRFQRFLGKWAVATEPSQRFEFKNHLKMTWRVMMKDCHCSRRWWISPWWVLRCVLFKHHYWFIYV